MEKEDNYSFVSEVRVSTTNGKQIMSLKETLTSLQVKNLETTLMKCHSSL